MSETRFIVNEMQTVVGKVNTALTAKGFGKTVYYMYGHPKEISIRLQELSNSATEGNKKYPLIILFTDIKTERNLIGLYGSQNLTLLIATLTEPTYTSEKRTALNFIPILQPIKEELINQIGKAKGFTFKDDVIFSETDLYFYGSQINNKNIFNDYIDAILLTDLKVILTNYICPTATISRI